MKISPFNLQQLAPPGSRATAVRPTQGGAVDGVQLDTAAEAPDAPPNVNGWLRAGMAAGLAVAGLAGVAGIAGCSAQSAPPAPQPSSTHQTLGNEAAAALQQQGPTGEMKFQVLPEGLGRVPLIRDADKYPDADTEQNDAYSPLGVYLGDGVFHDLHGNLVLVPAAAFPDFVPQGASSVKLENKWTPGYEIAPNGDGLVVEGMHQTITRRGDSVKVDGMLGADFTVQESQDRVQVDGPMFHRYDLTRDGDTIRSKGRGDDNYTVTRQGDTTLIDGPGDHDLTVRREGNRITVEGPGGRQTRITRDGDTISVKGSGPDFTLHREGDAVRLDSGFMRGSRTEYGR